ncbi:thiamine ABC transporter substrate-binding protein [Leucobacter luti]|uniref:Thiamine transport system substrate-binding protein n=1 Tax=Leucobacter luti TaxID=340320 RepID=A0A4Q7TY92_9MICO|nr:thiamine ABC transporter substrate-binding protein [Leucobacter luti]MBL3698618.1 thiamine ABC transporter substrate-binding protein [Leucobacter luti]RZT65993.1 thiamine transport system substrate-binding protein [Leucobacter luti]
MTLAHTRTAPRFTARMALPALAAALGLALAGCAPAASSGAADADTGAVTLAVHDSFPNEEFAAAASAATGYDVTVVSAGDGGELTNKLVLTKGAPIADAFFGVDTIFASRLVAHDVVEPYRPAGLSAGFDDIAIGADGGTGVADTAAPFALTPIDQGATCVNIDPAWFAEHGVAEPKSYADLAKPEYADLTVLLDPTASSTGASFLVGTVAAFGEDGFAAYWQDLIDNGARVEQGWSDAYNGQFTQGGGDGTKPIVVSYGSSPAFTVSEDGTETTSRALLDTCSNQVEYAGVLAGAANPEGARAVIDYLASSEFQATIPDAMYMYPVDPDVALPEAWASFAPQPSEAQLNDLPSDEIERGREGWLKTLSEQIGL